MKPVSSGDTTKGRVTSMKLIKRRQKHKTSILFYAAMLLAVLVAVVFTSPYLGRTLAQIDAFSTQVSFLSDWYAKTQDDTAQNFTLQQSVLDNISIYDDAGILADDEMAQEYFLQEEDVQSNEVIPPRPENAGTVQRRTISAGNTTSFIPIGASFVKNTTSLTHKQVQSIAKKPLPFSVEKTDQPQVLIYHTHASESFFPYATDWFDKSFPTRTTDNQKNIVAVGSVLAEKLTDAGIGVIHIADQFDRSYVDAYDRSRVAVEKVLKQYPSISVVLDIHRDAIGEDPVTAPVTKIAGQTVAQVMIIACKGTKTQSVPNHEQNLAFACALQKQLDADYKTLARPLLFGNRFYNQDLSVGALLIEIGAHGNTLDEAKRAMGYTANSLIRLLNQ